ncbi:MAG TPA: hypothetical protein VG603_04965 [Chitinophagales bacterium]|nr:hypothetical protein [Chitinophagales bacterium]
MSTPNQKRTSKLKIIFIIILVLVAINAIVLLICNFTYSDGYRAGVLIRFSRTGFIFKTYEGELNLGGMGNVPNTAQMNQMWDFSVKNKATADALMHLEGKRVSLHYREVLKNMPWQGHTHFFVDSVEEIKP